MHDLWGLYSVFFYYEYSISEKFVFVQLKIRGILNQLEQE